MTDRNIDDKLLKEINKTIAKVVNLQQFCKPSRKCFMVLALWLLIVKSIQPSWSIDIIFFLFFINHVYLP